MLAIIAGQGALPAALVERLPDRPLILSLQGFRPDGIEVDRVFRLEKLGSVLKQLRRDGVTEICFAGGIKRPQINPLAIDFATMPYLPTVKKALAASDDGALRAAIAVLEQAGFAVRAAHDIAPDLLPPAGIATRAQPDDKARKDAARGQAIVEAMAGADIGQARAVWRGQALAQPAGVQPTGHAVLDQALPAGGWPEAALSEILLPAEGMGELQLLWPTLARLTQAGERIVLVAPPHVAFPWAWQVAGVDLRWMSIVRCNGRDAL